MYSGPSRGPASAGLDDHNVLASMAVQESAAAARQASMLVLSMLKVVDARRRESRASRSNNKTTMAIETGGLHILYNLQHFKIHGIDSQGPNRTTGSLIPTFLSQLL